VTSLERVWLGLAVVTPLLDYGLAFTYNDGNMKAFARSVRKDIDRHGLVIYLIPEVTVCVIIPVIGLAGVFAILVRRLRKKDS
jgi:hypothetical protein